MSSQELLEHFSWIDDQLGLWKEGLNYVGETNQLKAGIAAIKAELDSARLDENPTRITELEVPNYFSIQATILRTSPYHAFHVCQ